MSDTTPTATTARPLVHHWSGTVALHRQPYCPHCAAPLNHRAWKVIIGVAFCTRCTAEWLVPLLKDAQFLRIEPVAEHVTEAAGICWYTPKTNAVRPAIHLAEFMELDFQYSQLPIGANLERLPVQ